jgi:hypothetical protein
VFRGNKVPWIVGAVLIVIFGIGAFVATRKEDEKKKQEAPAAKPANARALLVPADRQRTVVIPPCGTPLEDTLRNARAGEGTPGATTFELPRRQGQYTVLVPHCVGGTGSITLDGNLPSGALVLHDTERRTETEGGIEESGLLARSQVVVSGGASAETIVVPGCEKPTGTAGRDAVLGAGSGSSRVATAPAC